METGAVSIVSSESIEWDARFEEVLRETVPGLDEHTHLTPGLDLRAAGVTSLIMVQLLIRLESEYDVELPDELLTFQIFGSPSRLWQALRAASTSTASADAG
jgi:diaminopimelate decarboxylase